MRIEPINMASFDSVVVKITPHCKKHGAMNKMNVHEDGGGYWRCIAVVSDGIKGKPTEPTSAKNDCVCRAGCVEIRN